MVIPAVSILIVSVKNQLSELMDATSELKFSNLFIKCSKYSGTKGSRSQSFHRGEEAGKSVLSGRTVLIIEVGTQAEGVSTERDKTGKSIGESTCRKTTENH